MLLFYWLTCHCDVNSTAVLPASVHHLPCSPKTHLPHPLAPPGPRRQELWPQRRSAGSDCRRRSRGLREPQEEPEPGPEADRESDQEPEPEEADWKEEVSEDCAAEGSNLNLNTQSRDGPAAHLDQQV